MLYTWSMATKTYTQVEDDLDGSPDAVRVTFGLEGAAYEIDLSEKHLIQLRKALEPFVEKARRARGTAVATGAGRTRRPSVLAGKPTLIKEKGFTAGEVREWAVAEGIEVNDRGRIPDAIVLQYEEAQAAPAPKTRRRATKAAASKDKAAADD